ncbi:SmdA family multidrug ABC transporter permease/ATP-binding protein [Grimontia sp. NTOU-MAR1]|uniref:SmdA family multidrug ABC transporter permease/ATP-binding protein n=1 Tax=Grimontia sp. NTOU-MAR1 TaxID=3111011 RepID=UPI002DB99547|nr:SmdA family multidrug ABC transporter permease/ATP-binding protein [Grimontia sp. NTOU-MAR1]WRV99062.1 SmdA family multidrug ABC transporter permease/ATP-binding protein [Grimontia sp. NTOU-MAR1]
MRIFLELGWFFRMAWKRYIGAIVLLFFVAGFELIPPKAIGWLVDGVMAGEISKNQMLLALGAIIALWVVVYFMRVVWRVWLFGAAAQLGTVLRDKLYQHFTRHAPRFFERYRTGDLMARSTNDVKAVVMTAGEGVLTLADSMIMGIAVLIVMTTTISWELTLLALAPMPVMAIMVNRFGKQLHHRFSASQAAFSSLSEETQSSLNGIRMIRAFGLESQQVDRFNAVADDTGEKNMAVAKVDAMFDPVIFLTIGTSFFCSIAGGGYMVANGTLTLGELTAFTLYQGLMIWPMLAVAWLFNIIERGSAAWKRIKELLEEKPDLVDGDKALPTERETLSIAIDQFTWRGHEIPALRDVNVELAPGKMLGVAGPVGCGKTTILSLMLRLEDPIQGRVSYGGTDLRDFKLGEWRGKLAVVTQAPFLFSRSIADNIALGKPDATREEIREAAKLACIDEDIMQFPEGYETLVGEKGITLSGGQKQRISIARALLLDAEILVLDDALSAVDGRTEHHILKNLHDRAQHQTTVVIAHRLSALESADEIIVLQKGHIEERGKHKALVNANGWYSEMQRYQQLEQALEEAL